MADAADAESPPYSNGHTDDDYEATSMAEEERRSIQESEQQGTPNDDAKVF